MSAQQDGMNRTEVLKASPPMFESRWLDMCSRVHPAVPVLLFAPAIAILLTLGVERVGAVSAIAWVLGGYVFWTLTEYWMHRIVFHFMPRSFVWGVRTTGAGCAALRLEASRTPASRWRPASPIDECRAVRPV